jgi:phosphatidylglycerophosphate synthase
MTHRLVRCGFSANGISVASMFFGIGAGVALATTAHVSSDLHLRLLWVGAAVLIQCRLLANMLDGMVALSSGTASPLGELYNEVPDRASDTATLVGAGFALHVDPLLGVLAALAAVGVAYIRVVGVATGAGAKFCGPMAKPHRMFLLTAVCLWIGCTPATWQPVYDRDGWSLMAGALVLMMAGCVLTVIRRLMQIVGDLKTEDAKRSLGQAGPTD